MSDVVERAKSALEGVTEGPWGNYGNAPFEVFQEPEVGQGYIAPRVYALADAQFISRARSLVPELVAELERARDLIAEFRKRDESATRVIERLRSHKSLPPGMVWQDYYSPEDVCKIRADYEVIDAENERLLAIVERVQELAENPATYSGTGVVAVKPERIIAALEAAR